MEKGEQFQYNRIFVKGTYELIVYEIALLLLYYFGNTIYFRIAWVQPESNNLF